MKTNLLLAVVLLLFCSACSVSVSPMATPTGTINVKDNSLTEIRDGVAFTVKLDELSVASYPMVDNVVAFYTAFPGGRSHR